MATYGTWIIYPSKGDGKSILFDTGQSGRFIDNARDLGIDLKGLNYVVISHGHYDHSGGLERLIKEVNPNIRLYVGSGFFEKDLLNITGNLLLFSNFNRDEEFENTDPKMYIKKDGNYGKDMFFDEIALGVRTDKGLVVIVGCSHF